MSLVLFHAPLAAVLDQGIEDHEPVAVLGIDNDQTMFLICDQDGGTIMAPQLAIRIVDPSVRRAVLEARWPEGS